ncbi:MAG: phosphodiester glycosidase family protein [Bacteroidota bacterium]
MNHYNHNRLRYFVFFFFIALLLANYQSLEAKKKKKVSRKCPPISHTFIQDTILGEGIYFQRAIVDYNCNKHDTYIIKAHLKECNCTPTVIKAKENIIGLDKLQNIIQYYDSLYKDNIYGAVNANFWRAYSNFPIGPVVINGEIIQLHSYKEWSSIFFDALGIPFIDNFKISGELILNNKNKFKIQDVNRRTDSTGIVIYNKYSGSQIPAINTQKIEEIIAQIKENSEEVIYNDSTEAEFNLETMKEEYIKTELLNSIEFATPKISVEYLNEPSINSEIICKVIETGSNVMSVPKNGCIISLGQDFIMRELPNVGDTIKLKFFTNVHKKQIFTDGVCGTPRLVRNGIAEHEAVKEGSKSKRFIQKNLPRTAIGYNKKRDILYFVVIKPTNQSEKTSGANLASLSRIMKYIGCYDAMNLDGGGSTIMVIDGKNVINKENPYSSRRISVGVGIKSIVNN